MKSKESDKLKGWDWPFLRCSFGGYREYLCPHGVGHGICIHGCDGCCSHPSFKKAMKDKKEKGEDI